jgi:2-methylisocitrate lyase-like PEP mutase family enzyme
MPPHPKRSLASVFKALHQEKRGFIMPNAWDAGSAILLAQEGFAAIATTSAGIAFSLGRPDYYAGAASLAVGREEMFARMREIVEAVSLPVNGDLEAGYGDAPEEVAKTVRLAIEAGLAGGNIEDKKPSAQGLYDETLAVERIAAAREAIDAMGSDFVLTGRTDAFAVASVRSLETSIRRANLFREAGADCLYAPGMVDREAVSSFVREVAGPVNVVLGLGNAKGNAHAMLEMGVRRISLGGSIARAALALVRESAREVRDKGTLGFASAQIPQGELSALFERARGEAA